MMDLSTMVRRGHTISFGLFALCALIVAIISSAVVADQNKHGSAPPRVRDPIRFMVFAGWFGFLFAIIYVGGARDAVY